MCVEEVRCFGLYAEEIKFTVDGDWQTLPHPHSSLHYFVIQILLISSKFYTIPELVSHLRSSRWIICAHTHTHYNEFFIVVHFNLMKDYVEKISYH